MNDNNQRYEEIKKSDIIVSMLLKYIHIFSNRKRLYSFKEEFSYRILCVSDEILQLDDKAKENGVLLLNEIGLDPGIDHMSAFCYNRYY